MAQPLFRAGLFSLVVSLGLLPYFGAAARLASPGPARSQALATPRQPAALPTPAETPRRAPGQPRLPG
ncbi:hypothetical protein [Siccirubricoccus phaeus]|uniref:hypothetical protein n=1 Tax=Siccirubricoccus phaeus TaxID=2595053 RepID=UPI0011F3A6D4|nr:hypothetical protein [Siccirubricoccus phaeus]